MSSFLKEKYIKNIVAAKAFEFGMIKLDFKDPYELSSDKPSPVYIDARLWTQSPEVVDSYLHAMKQKIKDEGINYDVIGGGATGGIPYAERLAQSLHEPSIYIRKESKGYGKAAQIEGSENLEGETVLLVEDVITGGQSKQNFIKGIETAGGEVKDCLVMFDREQGGEQALREEDVELHSVLTLSELIDYGKREDKILKDQIQSLDEYIENTDAWEEKFLKENPDWDRSK